MTNARTAALYLRVSTDRQTTDNQRDAVKTMARARGYEAAVYEEVESAAKARPVYERMMTDARAGRVQAVAVVALDRLHRSMTGAINTVLELDRLGVPVMSVREGWLDTQGPVRPLLVAIFGWVAEQERATLIARTRDGIARARREGKAIGRPKASPVKVAAAVAYHQGGCSLRMAARQAGIGLGTLRRHLAA